MCHNDVCTENDVFRDDIAMWNRTGGSERDERRRRWWTDHQDDFAAALL